VSVSRPVKICPECDGTGRVYHKTRSWVDYYGCPCCIDRINYEKVYRKCRSCNGSGAVSLND